MVKLCENSTSLNAEHSVLSYYVQTVEIWSNLIRDNNRSFDTKHYGPEKSLHTDAIETAVLRCFFIASNCQADFPGTPIYRNIIKYHAHFMDKGKQLTRHEEPLHLSLRL